MEDKTQVVRAVEAAQRLSDAELLQVIEILRQDCKLRIRRADQVAALAFREGDWVETAAAGKKLPAGAKGHISRIRRGHVMVQFLDHGMWRVSAVMLRKTAPPPPVPPA